MVRPQDRACPAKVPVGKGRRYSRGRRAGQERFPAAPRLPLTPPQADVIPLPSIDRAEDPAFHGGRGGGIMARKRFWLTAVLLAVLAGTGCCRWCEHWCGERQSSNAPGYVQQCVPCCPVPAPGACC